MRQPKKLVRVEIAGRPVGTAFRRQLLQDNLRQPEFFGARKSCDRGQEFIEGHDLRCSLKCMAF